MSEARIRIVPPHIEFITEKYFGGLGHPDEPYLAAAMRLIEECGRVSHKSEGRIKAGSAEPFIKKIAMKYGHESIIEHVNYTVCIIGSRSMSHQLVRHRLAAYTQESQRYCDYSKDGAEEGVLNVIMPHTIGDPNVWWGHTVNLSQMLAIQANTNARRWCMNRLDDYQEYVWLRKRKVPAEDARSVLPNACKTEVYTTFNLRTWRHVLGIRTEKHAQWEIRYLMALIHQHFMEQLPFLFADIEPDLQGISELPGLTKK